MMPLSNVDREGFLEAVDQPVPLGGPVAKCYVNCCFVAPVRNGLRLPQRGAVEHEGMQAAFA